MLSAILLFLIFIGIAALLPPPNGDKREWLGFRFFYAVHTVVVALYVGNVLFGIVLSTMAVAALDCLGCCTCATSLAM